MPDDGTAARALDRVTGVFKKLAGNVIGDDDLAREGELQGDRAAASAEAERLEAEAQHALEAQQVAAEVAENRLAQEQAQAALSEDEREQRLARQHAEEAAAVAAEAEQKLDAVDRRAAQEQIEVARKATEVAAAEHAGRVEADALAEHADDAEQVADLLEATQENVESS